MIYVSNETKQSFKEALPVFEEACTKFYAGELPANKYKGTSGRFGSYGERGAKTSMLRLRFTGGTIAGSHLAFLADAIDRYYISMVHFTTGSALQLHHLDRDTVLSLYQECLDRDIICAGAGSDNPRNITASPLRGVAKDEYFDVSPYVDAAATFAISRIPHLHLPRKWKTAFSGGFENEAHATLKDLGFVAREDGTFDVYSGGGFGPVGSRLGIKVAEAIDPADILYYMEGFSHLYEDYGDHEKRSVARSRHIVARLGEDEYKKLFNQYVDKAKEGDFAFTPQDVSVKKTGPVGPAPTHPRITAQKQDGLYYVSYHPIAGRPDVKLFRDLCAYLAGVEAAEIRLNTDETAYIVNLTADEARKVAAMTDGDSAVTNLEKSVCCAGAAVCQQGTRDSFGLLTTLITYFKERGLDANALPPLHISGCPSTCTINRTASLGLRGSAKKTGKGFEAAFLVYAGGSAALHHEKMVDDVGEITEKNIPAFVEALVKALEGQDFDTWYEKHADDFKALVDSFE